MLRLLQKLPNVSSKGLDNVLLYLKSDLELAQAVRREKLIC
jgi:hypothetical protein